MAAKKVHGEVAAMGMVEAALEPLGDLERTRILRWAADRYSVTLLMPNSTVKPKNTPTEAGGGDTETLTDAGDLYAQAAPKTDAERALVVAYWAQESAGKGDFDSQTVNTKLKHLGHGVNNITRALDELKRQRPQLVIQLEKAGKTRQARKRYKVTAAGKSRVKQMLTGEQG